MHEALKAKREIIVCNDRNELAHKAALEFCRLADLVLKKGDLCTVALSGGSTPALLYERLLKPDLAGSLAWNKIAFFVSDERCVAPAHADSNFGNAARLLLDPLGIPESKRHPTRSQDRDPERSARDYEEEIRKTVGPGANGMPRFDIVFLGMGADGHTASLFPDTPALNETEKLVVKNHVGKLNADRITFTLPLINNAACVIFLVSGEDKAAVLSEVVSDSGKYPSEKVCPTEGRLIWFVDRQAAMKLDMENSVF
jgi:6-phosphogluconolactonase